MGVQACLNLLLTKHSLVWGGSAHAIATSPTTVILASTNITLSCACVATCTHALRSSCCLQGSKLSDTYLTQDVPDIYNTPGVSSSYVEHSARSPFFSKGRGDANLQQDEAQAAPKRMRLLGHMAPPSSPVSPAQQSLVPQMPVTPLAPVLPQTPGSLSSEAACGALLQPCVGAAVGVPCAAVATHRSNEEQSESADALNTWLDQLTQQQYEQQHSHKSDHARNQAPSSAGSYQESPSAYCNWSDAVQHHSWQHIRPQQQQEQQLLQQQQPQRQEQPHMPQQQSASFQPISSTANVCTAGECMVAAQQTWPAMDAAVPVVDVAAPVSAAQLQMMLTNLLRTPMHQHGAWRQQWRQQQQVLPWCIGLHLQSLQVMLAAALSSMDMRALPGHMAERLLALQAELDA